MPPKREPLKLATVGAVDSDGSHINHVSAPLNMLKDLPTHLDK